MKLAVAGLCKPSENHNTKLQGFVLQTYCLPTSDFCFDICASNKDCKSINYYQSNETCELNKATYLTHPESLIAADGSEFVHFHWRPVFNCSKVLCGGSPHKCVMDIDGYTYRCEKCTGNSIFKCKKGNIYTACHNSWSNVYLSLYVTTLVVLYWKPPSKNNKNRNKTVFIYRRKPIYLSPLISHWTVFDLTLNTFN